MPCSLCNVREIVKRHSAGMPSEKRELIARSAFERVSQLGKVDITENFKRERQFEPSDCVDGTYRTFERGGHKLVGCRRKSTGKFEVQSVLTPRGDGGEKDA